MADVASIQADGVYDVVLQDGREVQAQFAGAENGQQTLIVDDSPLLIAVTDIDIAEPPPPYYERVSHIDVNATYRDGNTDSQNTLIYADTRLRLGQHRHIADLTFSREEQDGISTKKQDLLRYEYNWLLDGPWYLGATASYERDPIKDLDHRYNLGLLVGRDFFNDDVKFLTASLGLGWSEEELGGVTDSGAVGLWKLIYEHKLRGGDLAFFHNHSLNYQFYGENNAIFKSNTGFRYDIFENVYANVALRYDYETEPAPGTEHYDTTLAVGVGAEF
jgi:putative salt-induced outer membrane protein YdiY